MKQIFFALIFLFSLGVKAQNVGIGTNNPDASAAFEVKDSARGMLIPRLTMSKRMAISNPAEGLLVYQTDDSTGFWFYAGQNWMYINSKGIKGETGERGPKGDSGVSVRTALVDNDSLILVLSSGDSVNTGNVRGLTGANGLNGQNAFGTPKDGGNPLMLFDSANLKTFVVPPGKVWRINSFIGNFGGYYYACGTDIDNLVDLRFNGGGVGTNYHPIWLTSGNVLQNRYGASVWKYGVSVTEYPDTLVRVKTFSGTQSISSGSPVKKTFIVPPGKKWKINTYLSFIGSTNISGAGSFTVGPNDDLQSPLRGYNGDEEPNCVIPENYVMNFTATVANQNTTVSYFLSVVEF
jgi:hypothetical protein